MFHQANLRIIHSVQKQFGIPDEKTFVNIEKYGNTSAASVPMALVEAIASDRVDDSRGERFEDGQVMNSSRQTAELPVVTCAGSPGERGERHGEALRALIGQGLGRWAESIEAKRIASRLPGSSSPACCLYISSISG